MAFIACSCQMSTSLTNIGNPNEITIREFAETVNRATGNPLASVTPMAARKVTRNNAGPISPKLKPH